MDSEQCVDEGGIAVPHTRVFCAKSLDLLDSKGVEVFGDDKEFVTV